MKRIDYIRTLSIREMAKFLMKLNDKDLGEKYCKSNCDTRENNDNWECPHPTECCTKWLMEEMK